MNNNPLNQKELESYGPFYSQCEFGNDDNIIKIRINIGSRKEAEQKHREIIQDIKNCLKFKEACKTALNFIVSLPYINGDFQDVANDVILNLEKTINNAKIR